MYHSWFLFLSDNVSKTFYRHFWPTVIQENCKLTGKCLFICFNVWPPVFEVYFWGQYINILCAEMNSSWETPRPNPLVDNKIPLNWLNLFVCSCKRNCKRFFLVSNGINMVVTGKCVDLFHYCNYLVAYSLVPYYFNHFIIQTVFIKLHILKL